MHKVVLKGKHSVSVKCSTCKAGHEIQANRHSHPVTMAFTHPQQSIKAKCKECAKDFIWSPEELSPTPIVETAPEMSFVPAGFDSNLEPLGALV
jgi:hypothetical protein